MYYLSIYLCTIFLYNYLSFYISIYLSIYLSIFLSIFLSTYLFKYLSTNLFAYENSQGRDFPLNPQSLYDCFNQVVSMENNYFRLRFCLAKGVSVI